VSVAERKGVEIQSKLTSLETEFRHWRDEASADGPLEKHHTQVEAVTQELEVPIERLRVRLDGLTGRELLAKGGAIEGEILDLHRIWDHFRSKLALRYVDHFALYLRAADELAYRCYERAEARGAPREPPLLYFGGERSPIIRPRGAALRATAANGDEDPVSEAVQRLPMPLIGLPWFQVAHLPDAPAIAHEVGHDVEIDLEMEGAVASAMEQALVRERVPEKRRRGWEAWRGEVFADVFGTLALGPAFTATLSDFLAASPDDVATQFQGHPYWERHPPSALRVLLSTATLELIGGFELEARQLRDAWFDAYPTYAMEHFACDVAIVADAVVRGPYVVLGGSGLAELISFTAQAHDRAERDARNVLRDMDPGATDPRGLVAAARLAFDADPAGYATAGVAARILDMIRELQTVGTRAGTATPLDAGVRAARAAQRGRWLADHLERAHAEESDEPDVH
jgi:hypothetical protein